MSAVDQTYLDILSTKNEEVLRWSTDIYNILKTPGFSEEAIEAVIRNVTSRKTKMFGKYIGCPLWSERAILKYKSLVNSVDKIVWGDHFVHEHVVPQNIIVEIFSWWAPHITLPTIISYIRWMLIGVVILKEEDRHLTTLKLRDNMPDEWWDPESTHYQEHWIRYRKAKIAVHSCEWNDKALGAHNEISYLGF